MGIFSSHWESTGAGVCMLGGSRGSLDKFNAYKLNLQENGPIIMVGGA